MIFMNSIMQYIYIHICECVCICIYMNIYKAHIYSACIYDNIGLIYIIINII